MAKTPSRIESSSLNACHSPGFQCDQHASGSGFQTINDQSPRSLSE